MSIERVQADIRSAVEELFGASAKLERPGMMERYAVAAMEATGKQIREAMGRCADKSQFLPTPVVFRDVLGIVRQESGETPRTHFHPEKSEVCPVCQETLRYFMVDDRWVPFANNGGLMFRELDGEWLAMRCWECRGPKYLRAVLPAPHVQNMAHYKPASYTPLGAMREAATVAIRAHLDGHQPWEPTATTCAAVTTWETVAMKNTLRRLQAEAAQAAELVFPPEVQP